MPSDSPTDAPARATLRPLAWRTNLWLFLATVASVFLTAVTSDPAPVLTRGALVHGAEFTGALLTILLAHEFGHFIAARYHKVDSTLPFFIPMPLLSPFGTMGAVIRMRSVIPTRKALLDIGASGPLAGLVFAIPLYIWGLQHSSPVAIAAPDGADRMELGDSLLLRLLDRFFGSATPDGTELLLSPVAFAAWAGMFVTMINLLPVSQLDGGHVAYALFGRRQNRIGQWVHRSLLVFFCVSLLGFTMRDVRAGLGFMHFGRHVGSSLFWFVWFEVLAILGAIAARARDPMPVSGGGLSASKEPTLTIRTRAVATLGLALLAGVGEWQKTASLLFWIPWLAALGGLVAMEIRWGTLRANDQLDHPATGAEPLRLGRIIVAIVTLALFVLLFMPTPISL